MTRSRLPWWADLALVVALALVAAVLAIVPVADWIRAAAALPLALVLPGYAVAAALFSPGVISRELRLVLIVAFSVGSAALGGMALQLVTKLDRPTWAGLLFGITALASVVALTRRDFLPADDDPISSRVHRTSLFGAAALLTAAALAGGAIAIATAGAHRQLDDSRFSSLWVLPEGPPATGGQPFTLGVSNHQGKSFAYRLVASQNGERIRQWKFRLAEDEVWQAGLLAPPSSGEGRLVTTLYLGGGIHRRVTFDTGGGT